MSMFYFDEEQDAFQERGGEGEVSDENDDGFLASRRRYSMASRPSDGFILGEWESDGAETEEQSEEDELAAQLVPMKMHLHRPPALPKRVRTYSRSKNLTFSDFYEMCDDQLGAGSYGSVKTCIQKTSGEEMAVKVVEKGVNGHSRARIMREVRTLQLCAHHPNIVQLVDWFEDEERYYMVFEKMLGGPLLSHIQRRVCFTEAEACQVTKDIASALKFLHDHGIAHRDVKPENVLCTREECVSPVKLCDLDLASHSTAGSRPLVAVASEPDLASPVGSAEFMAPEVVDAFVGEALKYDKRCDMWSLGVIVYIMLCGYPPFYGGDCGKPDCGWNDGEACEECQSRLFGRIQNGYFDFPPEEWAGVSVHAKHLISHLLVRNAKNRLTADEVLAHPWIAEPAPSTRLQTPGNLFRNDSARDVHQMSEHFNVMSRLAGVRLSSAAEGEESTSSSSSSPPSHLSVLTGHSDLSDSPVVPALSSLSNPPLSRLSNSHLIPLPQSCQSAVARQDSMSEMQKAASRHGEVNV